MQNIFIAQIILHGEFDVFVPKEESVKINIIRLKNLLPKKRKIKIVYYLSLVLGEEKASNEYYINYEYDNNVILAKNTANKDFKYYLYVSCSESINAVTNSKYELFGNGGINNPKGLNRNFINKLSDQKSGNLFKDNIIAISLDIDLEAFDNKEISLFFGAEENKKECFNSAKKYSNLSRCSQELSIVKKYWEDVIGKIQVNTGFESIDFLMNGWLVYQTYSSRFLGKTGYYQSGGAIGYRDQLQDAICLKYFDINILRNQIITCCEHQFEEGDVLHWWHKETSRGIRTRFSDDYLWLPYAVYDYLSFSNDYKFLNENISYLKGEKLPDGVDECYDIFTNGEVSGTVYEHCVKAIKKANNFGKNNLPKIGSGDWNDGFSNVGNKGEGESVWLGFFLYDILKKFEIISERMNDYDFKDYCRKQSEILQKSLNKNAWDGRWFKRAFCDDGSILGTIQNQECKIDSIAQSWSVISNAGDNDKKFIAMENLEKYLIDKENKIIKLLDPPFESSDLNPGYIKAYIPGIRENGGQYTHAAVWAIIAELILGFGDKAFSMLNLINPIEHGKTKDLIEKYKVEPYVIAADVYGMENLAGNGGWTWYTGSASWFFTCIFKYMFGIDFKDGYMIINPCVSTKWNEFSIKYKYKESFYKIRFINNNNKFNYIIFNGNRIDDNKIKFIDNRQANEVVVYM